MRWNPFINGIGAAAYVWGIGLLINHISRLHHDTPDNMIGSIAAISLFTFSAAVMAFLFFYRPIMLLIKGNTREAIVFFLKTIGVFGTITLVVILTLVF